MFSSLPLFPEQASTMAGRVDALFFFLVGVSSLFSVLIAVLLVTFAMRYRRKHSDDVGEAVHGSLVLEIGWSIIPFALAMIMFAWGAKIYVAMASPPADALQVNVVGRQWMWKLQHMEGRREINELHVPRGRPVKLNLTSEDVIHSFYVPAFRVKADAIPGRYTSLWFEATKPGRYHLFCAEYCGTQHSGMIGSVIVMEPDDYQAWLGGSAPGGSVASTGAQLFTQLGCATCHQKGDGQRGPSLVGVFGKSVQLKTGESVVADEGYLRESILNPQAKVVAGFEPVMPTFKGLVSEEGLMQLITFIKEQG